jgi:hypothetical protein
MTEQDQLVQAELIGRDADQSGDFLPKLFLNPSRAKDEAVQAWIPGVPKPAHLRATPESSMLFFLDNPVCAQHHRPRGYDDHRRPYGCCGERPQHPQARDEHEPDGQHPQGDAGEVARWWPRGHLG